MDLTQKGLRVTGTWNAKVGVNISSMSLPEVIPSRKEDLRNMSFIVITALVNQKKKNFFKFCIVFHIIVLQTKPYAMNKLSSNTLEGNERYEGFGIDLIKELSEISGFNYTFKIQEDGNSGYIDKKKWNGMIGEVINGVRYLREMGSDD